MRRIRRHASSLDAVAPVMLPDDLGHDFNTLHEGAEVVTTGRGLERHNRSDGVFRTLQRTERTGEEVLQMRFGGRFLAPHSVETVNAFIGFFGLDHFRLFCRRRSGPERSWKSKYGLRFFCEYLSLEHKEE
jgi:hypothetical protein